MRRATARNWTAGLLIALFAAGPAVAQDTLVARLPWIPADADTNDAAVYVEFARSLLGLPWGASSPALDSALRRAARLDPGSGDPPYLRAVAMLQPLAADAYFAGRRGRLKVSRIEALDRLQRADSLMREAWLREPFYDLELEPLLVVGVVQSPKRVRDPVKRAFAAYHVRDFALATASWGAALARAPNRIDLRLHRAHTFYWQGRHDSTVAELQSALAVVSRRDSGMALVLPPTYVLHYALAVAQERAGRGDSASESYARALVDNLGLYMAHVRLSGLLLARGDTAGALTEVAIAADIAPHEPWMLGYRGYLLGKVGRHAEAIAPLEQAIALDPDYSTPYFLLGLTHDAVGRARDALADFEAFLTRAAARDERRSWAEQRVAALRAAFAPPAGPRE